VLERHLDAVASLPDLPRARDGLRLAVGDLDPRHDEPAAEEAVDRDVALDVGRLLDGRRRRGRGGRRGGRDRGGRGILGAAENRRPEQCADEREDGHGSRHGGVS
jgi:hypothetical protein